ncbi:MAG: PorV/PorQ family protein [Chitinophagales bacterium]
MKLKNWVPFLIGVVVTANGFGQAETRKYSNEFMDIGADAKGLSMGNALTAFRDDVYAGYFNPAGLANINNTFQVGLTHAEWFAGIGKFDVGAVAVPFDDKKRVIGFTFQRFGVDDIPNTLFLYGPDGTPDYSKISSFSTADYSFNIHYAQKFKVKGLTAGGTVKIVYRHVGKFANAYGFGIDLGLQYRWKGLRTGLALRDITTTATSWSFNFTDAEKAILLATGNELPKNSTELRNPLIHLGVGYEVNVKDKFFIRPEVDFIFSTDGKRNTLVAGKPISMDIAAGMELDLFHIGFIRVGMNNIQRYYAEDGKKHFTVAPSIGAGVRIKVVQIDYALANLTALKDASQNNGLYSHVVSLRLDINIKKKKTEVKE